MTSREMHLGPARPSSSRSVEATSIAYPAVDTIVLDLHGTVFFWPPDVLPGPSYVIWARSPLRDDVSLATVTDWVDGADGEQLAHAPTSEEEFVARRRTRWTAAIRRLHTPDEERTIRLCELSVERRRPELFDDVARLLQRVTAQGLRWAICSNASPDIAPKVLQLIGAEVPPPVAVVLSWEVGALKPHERIYEELARQVDVERSLFVGDRIAPDVLGPISSGFRAAHLRRDGAGPSVDPAEVASGLYHGTLVTLDDLCPLSGSTQQSRRPASGEPR